MEQVALARSRSRKQEAGAGFRSIETGAGSKVPEESAGAKSKKPEPGAGVEPCSLITLRLLAPCAGSKKSELDLGVGPLPRLLAGGNRSQEQGVS